MTVRSRRSLPSLVLATLLLGLTSASQAIPITQPSGLNPGDEYRLLFVTLAIRNASSSDIADYNVFVTTAANGSPELAALGTTWTAVASTATVDARDNTSTNPVSGTGAPIYNLGDALVASSNSDLWDGELANLIGFDENGNPRTTLAWTGTVPAGVGTTNLQLGQPNAAAGWNGITTSGWTDFTASNSSQVYSVYGLSDVLVAVPEPGTAALMVLGLLVLAGVRRSPRS